MTHISYTLIRTVKTDWIDLTHSSGQLLSYLFFQQSLLVCQEVWTKDMHTRIVVVGNNTIEDTEALPKQGWPSSVCLSHLFGSLLSCPWKEMNWMSVHLTILSISMFSWRKRSLLSLIPPVTCHQSNGRKQCLNFQIILPGGPWGAFMGLVGSSLGPQGPAHSPRPFP